MDTDRGDEDSPRLTSHDIDMFRSEWGGYAAGRISETYVHLPSEQRCREGCMIVPNMLTALQG